MSQKRGHDDESTSSTAKRLKLAEPLLRKYNSIFEETQRQLKHELATVQLILRTDEDDVDQEEETSFEFSEVTQTILETRLGVRFSHHTDWTPQGILIIAMGSKYINDNFEPLFRDLRVRGLKGDGVRRIVASTYLFFVIASIKAKREIQIKAAIKARIESDIDFDIMSLMPSSLCAKDREQMLSAYLNSREIAGLPSPLSELSVDDKVEFVWWSNDLTKQSGLLDLEGVKDSYHIRLSAPLHDQNGQKITLHGVVDYGMFVYKTFDDYDVRLARCYYNRTQLSRAKSVEARLMFIENEIDENGRRRPIYDEPLMEASAQALAFSARFKIPNVRFIVTNSEDWVVAHLHNPLDGGAPEVVSDLATTYTWRNPYTKLYSTPLERDRMIGFWKNQVRTVYGMLMEWLLPENISAIPSPSPRSDTDGR